MKPLWLRAVVGIRVSRRRVSIRCLSRFKSLSQQHPKLGDQGVPLAANSALHAASTRRMVLPTCGREHRRVREAGDLLAGRCGDRDEVARALETAEQRGC